MPAWLPYSGFASGDAAGHGVDRAQRIMASDAGTILLTTCNQDGTAVAISVSVAFDNDRALLRLLRPSLEDHQVAPGLPRSGGRSVAVQHLGAVGVPCGGGPVRVQHQGPAPPVDHHPMPLLVGCELSLRDR